MQKKAYWESIYTNKAANSVSWFQEHAEISLKLIQIACPEKNTSIIDVGGGASTLVDDLLASGYSKLTVLDLSDAALEVSKARLGSAAANVNWLVADITKVSFPEHEFDIWHDRAVFHFLTEPEDRMAYIKTLVCALKPKGQVIISTFAEDGPTKCSGLPVMRYSAEGLSAVFGKSFLLKSQLKVAHHTPFDTVQNFLFCVFEKVV